VSNLEISHIIKWFAASKLVLNLDEMNIMELITEFITYYIMYWL